MDQVRYGIIGIGNQGSFYAGLFKAGRIKDAKLVAICDCKKERLDAAKEKEYAQFYYDNYIDMLESKNCDAVLVVTPHYVHPEMVSECLKRNINVICDKPAGVYTKQVREMNEVASKSQAKFAMMFNQRTNSLYRKMREIVQGGGIGELQRVNWIITDWFRPQSYYDSGNWRATWEGEGGGVLINQCPHQIDLIQWIVGKMPKTVRGFCEYGKWHDIEVEDEVTAFFEYENGATGVFITSTGEAPGDNRFEISGTKGKLICEAGKLTLWRNKQDSHEYLKTSEERFKGPDFEIINVETDGENYQHAGIIQNFTNALLKKEEFFVDGREGINGVELMNAIEFSGWNGGIKVSLPIDEDAYLKQLTEYRKKSKIKTGEEKEAADPSASFGAITKVGKTKA